MIESVNLEQAMTEINLVVDLSQAAEILAVRQHFLKRPADQNVVVSSGCPKCCQELTLSISVVGFLVADAEAKVEELDCFVETVKEEDSTEEEQIDSFAEPCDTEPKKKRTKLKKTGKVECPHCELTFYNEVSLVKHNKRCKIQVKCCQCENAKEFLCKEAFFKHTKEMHDGSFTCHYCFKVLETPVGWSNHVKMKHEVWGNAKEDGETKMTGKVKCQECDQMFFNEAFLEKHLQKFDGKLTCYQCTDLRQFLCKDAFLKHTKDKHDGQIQCFQCDKRFDSTIGWSNHVNFHDAETEVGQCDRCQKKFTRKTEYHQHITDMFKEDFPCKICTSDEKIYHTKSDFYKHVKDFHGNSQFACPLCEPLCVYASLQRFCKHMRVHWADDRFKCSNCKQGFRDRDERDDHQTICTFKNPLVEFSCETCTKKFRSERQLKRHEREIHSEHRTLKQCHICGQTFAKKSCYQQHVLQHEVGDPRPFKCDHCKKSFKTLKSIRIHMLCMHYPKDTGDFACGQCPARFQDQRCLTRHKKNHVTKTPATCEICGKVLKDKSYLLTHMKVVHTTEGLAKKFRCDQCNYATANKKYMKTHKLQHLSDADKPFQCRFCGKGFINKNIGIRHEWIHSDTRPFTCDVCGKTFRHSADLKAHSRLHTGEKPYECEVCGKRFSDRGCFRSHLVVHEKQLNITLDKSVKKQNLIIGENVQL